MSLFEIPSDWRWDEFGKVARVASKLVNPEDFSNAIHIAPNHIEARTGRLLPYATVAADGVGSVKNRFHAGQILYSKIRPYLAKAVLVDFDGVCSADMYPIETELNSRYLHRWMLTPEFTATAARRQGRNLLPKINAKELRSLPVPIPPPSIQKEIAAILDHADALRAKRRETVALLDNLAQCVFLDMFGDPAINPHEWPTCELGSLASTFSDGPFGSNLKSSHYVESGVRVIRLQNIGVGEFVDNDKAYISSDHFQSLTKHTCLPGDVLIATLGDPNVRACIQPDSIPVALNKADCVQMRVDSDTATAEYVAALLNQPSTEEMAQSLLMGQTRVRISMGRLRGLRVPNPPLSAQRNFSTRINSLKDVRRHYLKHLAELDALFASLQHRAFRGELWPESPVPAA